MSWTKEQERAITERGKNILVAAGAGSGKTAVMVERVIRLIREGEVSIDDLLIVTFTRAAAAEMKERIRASLQQEGEAMRRQLELLPTAQISTFDSFFTQVIRRFFFLTDLEPGLRVADEAEAEILLQESMDDLFEEFYEQRDEEGTAFLDWYAKDRDENRLRELLRNVYVSIRALPDPLERLSEKVRELNRPVEELRESEVWTAFREETASGLKTAEAFSSMAEDELRDAGLDRLADLASGDTAEYAAMAEAAEGGRFDEVRTRKNNFRRRATIRARGDEKPVFREIEDDVKNLRKRAKDAYEEVFHRYLYKDVAERLTDLAKSGPKAACLESLIRKLDEIYNDKKRERGVLDFPDLSHRALEILRCDEAAEYYRERFRMIFIDEYQDTNRMQEAIVDCFRREDNLFLVGDIKQSIYRFRLAEPAIFLRRAEEYREEMDRAEEEGREPRSIVIDLNRNFRSRPEILDGVNQTFRPIMPGYDERAELKPELPPDDSLPGEVKTWIIDPELETEKPEDTASDEDPVSSKGREGVEDQRSADLPEQELLKEEREALVCLSIIRENLGKPFHDQKAGTIRPLEYRDFVIMARSVRKLAGTYYTILQDAGVPLYVEDTGGFFHTAEIGVFFDLLKIIDNKYQDIPLIAVLHSGIFGFTPQELAVIRADGQRDSSYADAFVRYAEQGQDPALAAKARRVLEDLGRWKKLSVSLPLTEFLWELMNETGYYLRCSTLPDGIRRQGNLRKLVQIAQDFQKRAQNSLYRFIRYLEMIRKSEAVEDSRGGGIRVAQAGTVGEGENVVRLMTIHKSKGLEFPVVLLTRAGDVLQYDTESAIRFHSEYGIGMEVKNEDLPLMEPTVVSDIISVRNREAEVEENKRVLYVAMTRAREKLFLIGTMKKSEELAKHEGNVRMTEPTSFLKLMAVHPGCKILPADDPRCLPDLPERPQSEALRREPEEALRRKVAERMEYRYPFEDVRGIRPKLSVSEIVRESREERDAGESGEPVESAVMPGRGNAPSSKEEPRRPSAETVPEFLQGEKSLTAAERGTIYHKIMESIDFGKAQEGGSRYVQEEADRLVRRGILTEEDIRAVDLSRISSFFETDIGCRSAEASRRHELKKEEPFVLKKERGGEMTLVQGVIDCFFVEEGQIVLLDYKSNRTYPGDDREGSRFLAMYGEQIRLYREALEKAYGRKVGEAYLYLFSAGKFLEVK